MRHHNEGSQMQIGLAMLVMGAISGALLMFLFDPRMGKRRLTQIRDQVMSKASAIAGHQSEDHLGHVHSRTHAIDIEAQLDRLMEPETEPMLAHRRIPHVSEFRTHGDAAR